MRKKFLRSIVLGGLAGLGLMLWQQQPAPAADDVQTIEIIKNAEGKFVFSAPAAEINAGEFVKWVAKDEGVTHQLVPDTKDDAFKDTGAFDDTNPPTQKFKSGGVIKYHCAIHPKSMKGTITVTSAEAPAEAAKEAPAEEAPAKAPPKAPAKAKPKPSNDSGY